MACHGFSHIGNERSGQQLRKPGQLCRFLSFFVLKGFGLTVDVGLNRQQCQLEVFSVLLNLVEVSLLFDQLWQLGLPEPGDAGVAAWW